MELKFRINQNEFNYRSNIKLYKYSCYQIKINNLNKQHIRVKNQ